MIKRTVLLQEILQMRFEEAYEGWQKGSLTQAEAARLLGVHERTFRRYKDDYEEYGMDGLLDKRRCHGGGTYDKTNSVVTGDFTDAI